MSSRRDRRRHRDLGASNELVIDAGRRIMTAQGRTARAAELVSLLPSRGVGKSLRDIYLRSRLGALGVNVTINQLVLIEFPERVSIGSDVIINRGTVIAARAAIAIGHNTMIGPLCVINSGEHRHSVADVPMRDQGHLAMPIVIGPDVWIGAQSTVLRGVTIGTGAIVGAGAVVKDSIPPMAIAAGVPATVRGFRSQ